MAGAGYKLFNSGDVLTAAQVNTYLMEQTVMVFNDAAARTTALSGVLSEGMISYLKDTNATEVYNGSAWVGITGDGDITGVTAGTGISGGGTTGTVTITNDMATTITASGDIIVGTGSGTYDNLPIGTTGQVLTADTTVSPYKVKWAAAAASSPLTTKGDLYTYDTGNARLGVGANGETLVADSGTTTGLRWQGNYAAGKNAIINGDFNIWQRGTSISVGGAWTYTTDRWRSYMASGTATVSREAFTPGTAPVSGYEGIYFMRHTAPASGGQLSFRQSIENVQTFAGQTVTLSFWAKASTNLTLNAKFQQYFGSGGSADVSTSDVGHSITTSWTRFTQTVAIPSISGKTIGANNLVEPYFTTAASFTSSATLDIWGVQVEAGSVATPFTTATGTLQGELAACQRYYVRFTAGTVYSRYGTGSFESTTRMAAGIVLPVTMRVAPTVGEQSNLATWDFATVRAATAITLDAGTTPNIAQLVVDIASGGTAFRPAMVLANNTTNSYLAFGAEL